MEIRKNTFNIYMIMVTQFVTYLSTLSFLNLRFDPKLMLIEVEVLHRRLAHQMDKYNVFNDDIYLRLVSIVIKFSLNQGGKRLTFLQARLGRRYSLLCT
ncbi:hypothetical protein DDN98_16705 [Vibrio cholerae]|nr:hypothetical protein [Vibrio cholerae]EGR4299341.1 hypothetical protein [Vibrio cholerae]EGR5565280.1 hypothetical protein [Vibrio cholerae]EGR5573859.1 hypothetical protein [Vibrio cholerae]OFJ02587.1 hypothetical protein BFX25_16110 [Vibrio cholerae]